MLLKLVKTVMKLLSSNIRPRDIVTIESLENAARVVAASGGSTNAALHLPAIANEAGLNLIYLMLQRFLNQLHT